MGGQPYVNNYNGETVWASSDTAPIYQIQSNNSHLLFIQAVEKELDVLTSAIKADAPSLLKDFVNELKSTICLPLEAFSMVNGRGYSLNDRFERIAEYLGTEFLGILDDIKCLLPQIAALFEQSRESFLSMHEDASLRRLVADLHPSREGPAMPFPLIDMAGSNTTHPPDVAPNLRGMSFMKRISYTFEKLWRAVADFAKAIFSWLPCVKY